MQLDARHLDQAERLRPWQCAAWVDRDDPRAVILAIVVHRGDQHHPAGNDASPTLRLTVGSDGLVNGVLGGAHCGSSSACGFAVPPYQRAASSRMSSEVRRW